MHHSRLPLLLGCLGLLALCLAWLPGRGVAVAADPEVESLKARISQLEATNLTLRQEVARERAAATALRSERDQLAAALAAAQEQIRRMQAAGAVDPGPPPQPAPPPRPRPTIRMQVGRPEIQVNQDWYASDVPPSTVNGRVMLPVRAIAELLDYSVGWDETTRTVTLTPNQAP